MTGQMTAWVNDITGDSMNNANANVKCKQIKCNLSMILNLFQCYIFIFTVNLILKKRSWKNANNYYDVVIKTKQARKKAKQNKRGKKSSLEKNATAKSQI